MNQLQAHHVLWVLLGEEEAADLEAEAERRPTPVELLTAGTAEKLDANYAGTPCILPRNVHFFPKGVMGVAAYECRKCKAGLFHFSRYCPRGLQEDSKN